jgi:hypothetical protein
MASFAPANANHIDISPIVFLLRVHIWVTVYLGRRRDQEARAAPLGETQHVHRTDHAWKQSEAFRAISHDRENLSTQQGETKL